MEYIKELKPKDYQELKWINRKGYNYKQPAIFVNNEFSYWGFQNGLSAKWKKCLEYLNSSSKHWKNEKAKNKAFFKIWEFKNDSMSSITTLFPFEIYLLNNGFEFKYYGALTTRDPIRCYVKEEKQVNLMCSAGMTSRKFNNELKLIETIPYPPFCVQIDGIEYYLSHDIKDYKNLINKKGRRILNW